MTIVTKDFESQILVPLPTPDGNSLEEKVNTFLATLDPKDVLDVMFNSHSAGKYGINKNFTASVVYKV